MEGHHVDVTDDVFGWMLPAQLDWLVLHGRRHYSILEVGAWAGRSADVLSRATDGVLYVVDSWEPSTDPLDETSSMDPRAARDEYMRTVGVRGNVVTYEMTSAEAYAMSGHLSFDMIFLDADHRYEAVREDILMWRSRLRRGGLLCGHDGEYASVRRAVDELVPDAQFHETPQPPLDRPSVIWWRA
jgi:predicted O-methyltransferase YrrM